MISCITPEDRETWDRKMKEHSRRLKRQGNVSDAKKTVLLLIMMISIIWLVCVTIKACSKPYTPPRIPDQVVEDTVKISRRKMPVYDSTGITGWGFQWGHRVDRKTTYAITFDFGTVAWAVGLKGKWHVVDTCRWDAFNDLVKSYKAKRPKARVKL